MEDMASPNNDTDIHSRLRKWRRCANGMFRFLKNKYIRTDDRTVAEAVRFRLDSVEESLKMVSNNVKLPVKTISERVASPTSKCRRQSSVKLQKSPHLCILENVCRMESRKHEYLQECVTLGIEKAKKKESLKRKKTGNSTTSSVSDIDEVFSEEAFQKKEILTPFDAVANFKRRPPSYWIGCSYNCSSESNHIDMTIRQTGELTDPECSKLSSQLVLNVSLVGKSLRKKQTQTVVLKHAEQAMQYRSSHVSFSLPDDVVISELRVRFHLYLPTRYSKKKVNQWEIPLDTRPHFTPKSEWHRVLFVQKK